MSQPIMSRSQRRIEKKQTLLVLALILVVAAVSFALGVMVGQSGGSLPGFADSGVEEVRLPSASQAIPVPPVPVVPDSVDEPPKLTFYDNLPKGDQAPLGSGINLPPEVQVPEPVAKLEAPAAAPASGPAKSQLARPVASPQGAFVVQVASFRSAEDATKLQARLEKQGLTTFRERVDLGEKGIWFRVFSGPYVDRPAADRAVALLKAEENLTGLVRKR